MGIPLMIQEQDNQRREHLKKDFGLQKKIDVIRAGLKLLEKEVKQKNKIKRWKQATKLVIKSSLAVNKEFSLFRQKLGVLPENLIEEVKADF